MIKRRALLAAIGLLAAEAASGQIPHFGRAPRAPIGFRFLSGGGYSFVSDFTAASGTHLETLPGWYIVGGYTGVTPTTNGSGQLVGNDSMSLASGQLILHRNSGNAAKSTTKFVFSDTENYVQSYAINAADGANHISGGFATFSGTNCNMAIWVLTQGGTTTNLGLPGTTTGPDANGKWTVTFNISADGKTLSGTVVGASTVSFSVSIAVAGAAPVLGVDCGVANCPTYGTGGIDSGGTLYSISFTSTP